MKNKLFILLQYCLPQHTLSRFIGKIAEWHAPTWLLQPLLRWFVKKQSVDMSIALKPELQDYPSFNAFFIRKLKAEARPIANDVVSPADGSISQISSIKNDQIFQAKGINYSLHQLLAKQDDIAEHFIDGQFSTIYLSPRDYHRVHMPCDGQLLTSTYVPGKLFSVNPTTVNAIDGVFARNERLINIFNTDKGKVAVILVGAMLVAGIQTSFQGKITPTPLKTTQTWHYEQENIYFKRGEELGYFNFGSTVILLFEKNTLQWRSDLKESSALLMGETLV
jgi:phosphatidylserine decarboxylase